MSETERIFIDGIEYSRLGPGWIAVSDDGVPYKEPEPAIGYMSFLDTISAARREVETVTREREEWRARHAQDYEERVAERESLILDLATSRAALEDVRGILRTIADMWDDEKAMHEISATAYEMSNIARRALAQEAGDETR